MAESEIGFVKPKVRNVKEEIARMTLRKVKSEGHTYVDLRQDGKRCIFFCTLCLAPCYSDTVLYHHLRGSLHKDRLSSAKATLIRDNPWPFNDGVLFFANVNANDEQIVHVLDQGPHVGDLSIVVHNGDGVVNDNGNRFDEYSHGNGNGFAIPGVIVKDDITDLHVKLLGYGKISGKFMESDGICAEMQRIWCEWLGKRESVDDKPSHDFAIVTFSYHYDLGKQGLFDEIKTLLLTGVGVEESNDGDGDGDGSSGDDSQGSVSCRTSSALCLHRYDDDQLRCCRIISSKTLRREMRRRQRVASEKLCDICQHKMLPGKDVATLLNLKTGRLACSSRNIHGAFHVFHTSCLIHWILLCEYEMFMKPPVNSKVRRRSNRKTKSKLSQMGKECKPDTYGVKRKRTRKQCKDGTLSGQICSVFCPDCQGTGLQIEGNELEKPTIPLSEMFKYKIKAIDAHREWMKCPENLENCSTGFAFPVLADHAEGMVSELKLLHIYRADEDRWCQTC